MQLQQLEKGGKETLRLKLLSVGGAVVEMYSITTWDLSKIQLTYKTQLKF